MDVNLDAWWTRANGGDSRYAIALALMAIADAIRSGKTVGSVITELTEIVTPTIDEKFDILIKTMEGMKD